MARGNFANLLQKSRRLSIYSPLIAVLCVLLIVTAISSQLIVFSVLGTLLAASIAAIANYTRMHYETQKYVRFAIRARLAKRAEPDFDRIARSFRTSHLGKVIPKSSHPSPEITQALREAEKNMGMRQGSTMALAVPLELILGVEHNCPSAAAMLYAGRHPVVLIDDHLQLLLDKHEDYEKNYNIAVSVLCHELAHLIGWNTRWNKITGICDLFISTVAMAAVVANGIENSVAFGAIGAFIAIARLLIEPISYRETSWGSFVGILSRLSYVIWFPYIVAGLVAGYLSLSLMVMIGAITITFKGVIAYLRRREELCADSIAAKAVGSSSHLSNFFRSLDTQNHSKLSTIFATHPSVSERIYNLRHSV